MVIAYLRIAICAPDFTNEELQDEILEALDGFNLPQKIAAATERILNKKTLLAGWTRVEVEN